MLRADTKVQPSFSVAHDGITLAMTREAFDLAPEVWAGELGDWRQLTEENAAAKVAVIANWQSYYGQNSISTWMTPFFGASVYDDPAVYAKCLPMNFL